MLVEIKQKIKTKHQILLLKFLFFKLVDLFLTCFSFDISKRIAQAKKRFT